MFKGFGHNHLLLTIHIAIALFLSFHTPKGILADSRLINSAAELEAEAERRTLHWKLSEVSQAVSIYLKAADIWQNTDKAKAASCYREAGKLLAILGDKKNARINLEIAARIASESGSLAEQSKVLSELGSLSLGTGSYKASELLLTSARSLAVRSDDSAAKSLSLDRFGALFFFQRNLDGAAKSYEQSIELSRSIGDQNREASALAKLGFVYLDQNRYASATDVLTQSLSIFNKIGDIRGQAMALKGLGTVLNVSNQKQKALEYYKLAEVTMPNEIDLFEQATLFNGFGSIYEYYGDWALSTNYRKKALWAFEQESHNLGQLVTLTSLGRLGTFGEKDDETLDYFDRALSIAIKLGDNYYRALISEYRADYFFTKHKTELSARYHLAALALLNENTNARQFSRVLRKLGQTYASEGRELDAYNSLSKSLAINHKVQDKFAEAETLFQIATLTTVHGAFGDRLELCRRSVALTESLAAEVANSRLQTSFVSNAFDRYELHIDLLMKAQASEPNGNFATEALREAERSRTRAMLESLSLAEGNFTADAVPEAVQKAERMRISLNAKSDKLTDLLSRSAEQSQIDKLDAEINELQHQLEEIKAELKQKSPVYSAIKDPPAFDLGDFQANVLDNRSVLLEFSLGKEESYLWVVGKADFAAYVLPGRYEIEKRVEGLRGLLAARQMKEGESIDEHQRRVAEAEALYWPAARELSTMILGQAAEKIRGKRLIVVPDGKLHYFPLSALPLPDAVNNEPMVLTNEVVYQPSAQTLSLLTKMSASKKPAERDLLIFSDPVFTADDERLSGVEVAAAPADVTRSDNFRFVESLGSLARLPGSGTEATSITDIVGGSATDSFSGFGATRDRLLETKVSDYKILHFATHGVVNNERPELSGIVMSRYGGAGEQLNEFIRLQDIYGMKLNADLVVLSACETGVGKEVRGEGLMSLNNAFLQSGARTVLASLWKVEDGASQILMKEFYNGISSGGLTPSEALRQAQMKLARDPRYSSPFYWAAFTLQGDLNVRPDIANGIPAWAYGLAVVPLAVLGIYLWRRRAFRVQASACIL